jgi:hypothetical protein
MKYKLLCLCMQGNWLDRIQNCVKVHIDLLLIISIHIDLTLLIRKPFMFFNPKTTN